MSNYRVWCMSWDEKEEDGVEIHPYDPKCSDDRLRWWFMDSEGAANAAKKAADWYHARRNASFDATWPLTFRVRDPGGKLTDHEVDREIVPEFVVIKTTAVASP